MAEPPPRVSVVLPTRDRPEGLRRAVRCVRAQSMTNWELLVVDDASSEPAARTLEGPASEDGRIRILRAERPGGAGRARNRGIAAARAPLVAFLDDDDLWPEEFLERMSAALDAHPKADIAYAGLRRADGPRWRRSRAPDVTSRADALQTLSRGNFIGTPAAVVRLGALRRVGGFDPDLPRLQDWDLWLRAAGESGFVRVGSVVVDVGGGDDRLRITRDLEALRRAALALARKHSENAPLLRTLGHMLISEGLTVPGRELLSRGSEPGSAGAGHRIRLLLSRVPPLYRALARLSGRFRG